MPSIDPPFIPAIELDKNLDISIKRRIVVCIDKAFIIKIFGIEMLRSGNYRFFFGFSKIMLGQEHGLITNRKLQEENDKQV
ncbi:hypothetical protein [Methanosarcina sp.]|uniref:hypothetical protein n=1 Tax=Methanosarcina sp. TaxID=2213 RepID=UPI002989210E|nr:hypothetical protein [Methanosarcina sp.]MDW5550558.1 hypothetical protein [Methanosarcina sp.]MDW5554262.1 hypothetical protein [Methanosarcina sp.]MDW5559622.1 hypothetical protein [Methanosarcina sp.]